MQGRGVIRLLGSLVLAGTLMGLAPLSAAAATRTVQAGAGGLVFDPRPGPSPVVTGSCGRTSRASTTM